MVLSSSRFPSYTEASKKFGGGGRISRFIDGPGIAVDTLLGSVGMLGSLASCVVSSAEFPRYGLSVAMPSARALQFLRTKLWGDNLVYTLPLKILLAGVGTVFSVVFRAWGWAPTDPDDPEVAAPRVASRHGSLRR